MFLKEKKNQYKVLWGSLCLCLFIFIDVFAIPSKSYQEICTKRYKFGRYGQQSQGTYRIRTEFNNYNVDAAVYGLTAVGKPITVVKSALTTSYRKIEVKGYNYSSNCDISFISGSGFVVLIFITTLLLLFMLFYEKISYVPGRKHLTMFLSTISLLLLYLHIRGATDF